MDLHDALLFLDTNPRYKALFLLLLRAEGFKTSEALGLELGVSSRTVKTDLQNMRRDLQKLELQLLSKPSKGFLLLIKNPDLATELKEYFQIYQAETLDTDFDMRVQYILRRLLTSEAAVKVEALEEELCLSVNNSLTRELQQAKKKLSGYRLELRVRPHYGLSITGKRFAKIMFLVRLYKLFNKGVSPQYFIDDYNKLFSCSKDNKEIIRSLFCSVIKKYRIVFSDIYAERFVMYLVYFLNQAKCGQARELELPVLAFRYQVTEEFALVQELLNRLYKRLPSWKASEQELLFLTYIALMSTDLYRFRDCTEANYDSLYPLANTVENFVLKSFGTYLQIDMFHDYTCTKDLLKIILPISLKILLGISDDVDLGFRNLQSMEYRPVFKVLLGRLCQDFSQWYHYLLSEREQYLIFLTILGLLNRIKLPHSRLNLAIIALDGRLSTQQLKFNLQRYFMDFIEKIETKVLYELHSMPECTYDYYLCMEYGKNMNIPYKPIYYAREGLRESEYVESLNQIFFAAYNYDKILPAIELFQLEESYRFAVFPVHKFLESEISYAHCALGAKKEIQVYFRLTCQQEHIRLFYFENAEAMTIYSEKYFLIIELDIKNDIFKLKMFLNWLDRIAENPEGLAKICLKKQVSFENFFIK